MARALITGITGQDGSYLAELLLGKGYEVHGLIRRASTFNTVADRPPLPGPARRRTRGCSCTTATSPTARAWSPCCARSTPTRSTTSARSPTCGSRFDEPEYTGDTTGLGADAAARGDPRCRASSAASTRRRSSEMFGATPPPQNEETPVLPALARTARRRSTRYWVTRNYREAYGMFAVNGILFNHESPRRGETFVTRKITRAVAAIKAGLQDTLYMGNLDAVRDWGYAPEYVEGMWRMLQADEPDDYVLATGARLHGARLPARSRSSTPASTGRSTSGSTSATCARPRSTR